MAHQEHPVRIEVFTRIIAELPRLPLIELGAGHCTFSRIAHEAGFSVTSLDARRERVPADIGWPFIQQDVREADLSPYGIVCPLGLLYHLTLEDHCALLVKCRGKIIVLDTHEADPHWCRDSTIVHVGPYEGMRYREDGSPLSSTGNLWSYWHTDASLRRLFVDHGFSAEKVRPPIVPTRSFWVLRPTRESNQSERSLPSADLAGLPSHQIAAP